MRATIEKIFQQETAKGCVIKFSDEKGREFFLQLHTGWEVELSVSKGNHTTVTSIQRVHPSRIYPHSGPAPEPWVGETDKLEE